MKAMIVSCLLGVMLLGSGCKKYERSGNVDQPGIALTFDDYFVDNWYEYLPLLDSFGAKVTFYVSSYHNFTAAQKDKLREIQRHGHEIAFHTSNHYNLVDYMRYNGMDKLLQYEIYDDLNKMNKDGFYPKTFAYPYGANNEYLHYRLLKIFKSVRLLNGSPNFSKSVTATSSNTVLYALGLDNNRHSLDMLHKMIDLAQKNKNCLVMVAHQIQNPNAKFKVSYEVLKDILKKIRDKNMRFYTVSEISN